MHEKRGSNDRHRQTTATSYIRGATEGVLGGEPSRWRDTGEKRKWGESRSARKKWRPAYKNPERRGERICSSATLRTSKNTSTEDNKVRKRKRGKSRVGLYFPEGIPFELRVHRGSEGDCSWWILGVVGKGSEGGTRRRWCNAESGEGDSPLHGYVRGGRRVDERTCIVRAPGGRKFAE